MGTYQPLERTKVYESPIFRVFEGRTLTPAGTEMKVSTIDAPDWVNVIPLDAQGHVLMIRQYRHGSGLLTWEFPGGMVDGSEDPAEAALRELEEETGWTAGKIIPLGSSNPNPAFMTNTVHFFLATELRNTGAKHLDEHEATEERFWPWEEVEERLGDAEFNHGIMLNTAWFYKKWKKGQIE